MNGHAGWKEEIDALGPKKKNTRDYNPNVRPFKFEGKGVSAEHYSAVVAEGLSVLAKKLDKTVAVLYGVRAPAWDGVGTCQRHLKNEEAR